jgi:hypothetical protein
VEQDIEINGTIAYEKLSQAWSLDLVAHGHVIRQAAEQYTGQQGGNRELISIFNQQTSKHKHYCCLHMEIKLSLTQMRLPKHKTFLGFAMHMKRQYN